ncbi:hypothetical protein HT746_24990 [Burkholderia pyrrocinia]|uniref:BtrH N-terminal domain-containing protein n=1 Tax=Burkholderia pyrrocinia TaxID=60550 RepID=UPI001577254C|nr:BtrH N-terminal domain-containing protein [Burkholderia pyrrocinia]NTX30333.1 hypothetical protein [Burkholderia pyrrocinia]
MTENYEILSRDPDSSVNCFFGGFSRVAAHNGINASESDIFCFGEGYFLESIIDEYGLPELSYPFHKTIAQFCRNTDITLKTFHLRSEISSQVIDMLRKEGPVVCLTNTAGLPYLHDKYSKVGYTHAITILDADERGVHVLDRFVSGTPPSSCEVLISWDSLDDAIRGVYEFPQYTKMGVFFTIENGSTFKFDESARRKQLRLISDKILASDNVRASAHSHFSYCAQLIAQDPSRATEVLDLLAYDITTDHVIPSRALLKKTIDSVSPNNAEFNVAFSNTDRAWRDLANLARICAKKSTFDKEKIFLKFERAIDSEIRLWGTVNLIEER